MRSFSQSYYVGEHLIWGQIGEFLVVLSLVSTITSFLLGFYTFWTRKPEGFDRQSRLMYKVHAFSIFAIFGLLIAMFYQQLYEYHYIWRHSSRELPWYYILSAFWEGQEGSFLLWMFWHSVLGLWIAHQRSELSLGVLSILALVQAMLSTMLLGWQIGDVVLGSNPFVLLRHELSIPILSRANYLELIRDGNGLNILLQNYWMVIHPPVLFLGFASVTIPFAYAFATLIRGHYVGWTREVLPWALFALTTLGAGILMGGMWAYEALSFGGFWAWDPVENASLVPWLFLVAALHTTIVYNATGHSLRATYILYIFAFAFVLYSTFLTRSGILGDSSVHSFTDLGMTGQLLVFLAIFLIPSFLTLSYRWSRIPEHEEEENTWTREFWLFAGALFVVASAIQITFSTSIPVWNKLFGTQLAPPINANQHYNSIQIWFAILVVFLMGIVPMLRYRSGLLSEYAKRFWPYMIASVILSIATIYFSEIPFFQSYKIGGESSAFKFQFLSSFFLLTVVCWWSIILTAAYAMSLKIWLKVPLWGGSLAHLGFVVLILGALISQYQKRAISYNTRGIDFGKEFDMEEQTSNMLLVKNQPETLPKYRLTYLGKTPIHKGERFSVAFVDKFNPSDSFVLYPEAMYIQEGANTRLNAEPSIHRMLHKDIFTHITSVPKDDEATGKRTIAMKISDTVLTSREMLILEHVKSQPTDAQGVLKVIASIKLLKPDMSTENLSLQYNLNTKNGQVDYNTVSSADGELTLKLEEIDPSTKEFKIHLFEKNPVSDWIIFKVLEFPGINILWLGCVLMVVGSGMSAYYRRRKAE